MSTCSGRGEGRGNGHDKVFSSTMMLPNIFIPTMILTNFRMFVVVNGRLAEATEQNGYGERHVTMLRELVVKHPLLSTGALLAVVLAGYTVYRCGTQRRRTRQPRPRLTPHPTYPGETLSTRGRRCYPGLRNIGNSCYLSCVLQALAAVHDQLVDGLDERSSSPFVVNLLSLLAALNAPISADEDTGATVIDPTPLVRAMGGVLSGEQQDAHELLQAILGVLGRSSMSRGWSGDEGALASLAAARPAGVVAGPRAVPPPASRALLSPARYPSPTVPLARPRPAWEGDLVAVVKCTACGATGESGVRTVAFSVLTLRVENDGDDLETCFAHTMAPVALSDFACPICHRRGQCVRLESVLRWPSLLIVHVQRGRHSGWSLTKDERRVRFAGRMGVWRQPWELVGPGAQSLAYDLVAVVEHLGGALASGHYQTHRRVDVHGGGPRARSVQWLCCSDATVRPVGLEQVLQAQAYLLFYKLISS